MIIVAEVPKNSREVVRVTREFYSGIDIVNVRTFYMTKDCGLRPGKQGLALRAELVSELVDALVAALQVEVSNV